MGAGPAHLKAGPTLALLGSGRVGPRANRARPCPWTVYMVAKQRRERRFIEERREKRIRAFGTSAPTNAKLIHVRQCTHKRVQHSSLAPTTHSSSPTATHGVEAPPTVLEDQSLISENPDVPADPEDGTIPGESTHVSEAMEINA